MSKCPSCFVELPGPPAPHGPPARAGRRSGAAEPTAPSPPTGTCPGCGLSLPQGWQHHSSTNIVMAGARTTGKSIFIAVMIKQFEQYAIPRGTDVSAATPAVKRTFEDVYVRPLYEARGIMPPTPRIGSKDAKLEPLVFVITTKEGLRHHLVIRDVAGEDLEKPHELDPGQLSYFARADYVFFLFDPLRVDDIRNQLRDLVPMQDLGGDPRAVLESTLWLAQGGSPRIGVVMSKFDTMQALRRVKGGGEWTSIMQNAGAAFFCDPGPAGFGNDSDGEQLHEEVRSLLLKLNAATLVARVQRATGGQPGAHRFFAVSALGDPPNGEVLHARGIAPFRCLDPLRWALTGTGVMG